MRKPNHLKYKLFMLDVSGIVILLFGIATGTPWFFAALFLGVVLVWLWMES